MPNEYVVSLEQSQNEMFFVNEGVLEIVYPDDY